MKLTSIIRGQTLRTAKPSASFGYFPDAIKALTERYGFVVVPKDLDHLFPSDLTQPPPPAIFRHGKVELDKRLVVIDELQVFLNGIIVSAQGSTTDTDLITENVLRWARSHFSIEFEPIRPDAHYSQVEVRFDRSLADLFAPLKEIAGAITKSLDDFWEVRPSYELMGLQFGFDALKAPKISPGLFRIERRAETPYEQNLYFSDAATMTDNHLTILARFERICLENFAKT